MPSLVVLMSKPAGWDFSLSAAGVNSVCQDPCAVCCKQAPPPYSVTDSVRLGPADSSEVPVGCNPSGDYFEVTHCAGGRRRLFLLGCPFSLEEPEAQGRALCLGVGEGQCSLCVTAAITLLMQSVLVFEVQRCFPITSIFWDSINGVLLMSTG